MNVYRENTSVAVTVPFEDEIGNSLTVTSVAWRVIDEDEVELIPETPAMSVVAGDTQVEITVDATLNQVGPARRGIRTIQVFATTEQGVVTLYSSYVIEPDSTLAPMENTFITLPHAMMIASDMVDVDAFHGATQRQKASALSEAFLNIIRLRFSVNYENDQERIVDKVMSAPGNLGDMDYDNFLKLPARMIEAILRAQVVEADFVLGGDPIEERRRQGLMSETIGETSNMFRPGKPIMTSVSPRALRYLSQYIETSKKLAR